MTDRKIIKTRVTTSHPIEAYGGYEHPEGLLEMLAEGIRAEVMPLQVQHDARRPLNGRCLAVEIVDLDDGHRAVDAEYEVDADAWDAFAAELEKEGVPGGMSFSYSATIVEFDGGSDASQSSLEIFADPAHFSDNAVAQAAERLSEAGPSRGGRLYQFNHAPTCRMVVEYVHDSGGLSASALLVQTGIALVATAIAEAVKGLLKRRKPDSRGTPIVEVHVVSGDERQRMTIEAESDQILGDALDALPDVAGMGDCCWDSARGLWRVPDRRPRDDGA